MHKDTTQYINHPYRKHILRVITEIFIGVKWVLTWTVICSVGTTDLATMDKFVDLLQNKLTF